MSMHLLRTIWLAILLASPAAIAAAERPPVDLPAESRHANYGPDGSCGYAAAQDLLALAGRKDLADHVGRHYSGPVTLWPGLPGRPSLSDLAEDLRLPYDFTAGDGTTADERWLTAVSDRGWGAVISWRSRDERGRFVYDGAHAVTFLGFDADGFAWLINNNCPKILWRFPHAQFMSIWTRCGANAFTLVRPEK